MLWLNAGGIDEAIYGINNAHSRWKWSF